MGTSFNIAKGSSCQRRLRIIKWTRMSWVCKTEPNIAICRTGTRIKRVAYHRGTYPLSKASALNRATTSWTLQALPTQSSSRAKAFRLRTRRTISQLIRSASRTVSKVSIAKTMSYLRNRRASQHPYQLSLAWESKANRSGILSQLRRHRNWSCSRARKNSRTMTLERSATPMTWNHRPHLSNAKTHSKASLMTERLPSRRLRLRSASVRST